MTRPPRALDVTPGRPIHASCVSLRGRGLLILGPAGAGKSALALQLMAHGATLVADDGVLLRREGEEVMADCPAPIRGRIEARGVGLLRAVPAGPTPVILLADLGSSETERLPPRRITAILGREIETVRDPGTTSFAAALMQYLRHGRGD